MKINYKYIFFFLMTGGVLFSSCKKGIPSEVIQPDQMEALLYDYHIANAIGTDYNGEERYKRELLVQYVFKKHHTTEAQFDSSMVWYTRNTGELNKIYERVGERLKKANETIAQLSDEGAVIKAEPLSGDTVNLWRLPMLYRLSDADMTNKLTFTIPTDTSYKPRDRYMWKVSSMFPISKEAEHTAEMELSVRYQNDSTVSVCQKLVEGVNRLYLQTDTLPVKEVRGFIYYDSDSLSNSIQTLFIHNISLMRYHTPKEEISELQEEVSDTTAVVAKKDSIPQTEKVEKVEKKDTLTTTDKEPSRLTPKELREQNRPQTVQPKKKPQPKAMPATNRQKQSPRSHNNR